MERPGQHILGRADLDDASEIHHRDPVGDGPREPEVVRHHQDGQAELIAEPEEKAKDLAAHRRVEVRHGLVGHQHHRIENQGSRDHHPLALPSGELVRVVEEEPFGGSHPGL